MTLLSVLVNASRYSYPLSPLFVPRYRSLPNFSKSPPPCLNLHKQKSSPIPASVWVRPPIHHKDQTPQAHAYPLPAPDRSTRPFFLWIHSRADHHPATPIPYRSVKFYSDQQIQVYRYPIYFPQ